MCIKYFALICFTVLFISIGGTADITVHEKLSNVSQSELIVANGIVKFTFPLVSVVILRLTVSNSRSRSKYAVGSKIALRGDKMRVDADVMKSLFDKTINNIVSLVKDVLTKLAVKDVPLLLPLLLTK
jgi:hypothetical protein